MSMDISREAVPNLHHGHTTVGTSSVVLTPLGLPIYKGVLLRCPGASDPVPNTAPVWVGGPGVTANSAATGGIPLLPGDVLFVPIVNPSLIYLVSTASDQDVAWMFV